MMMKIFEIRRALLTGPKPIEWDRSKIVEMAELTPTGGVKVMNIVTKKVYQLPKRSEHYFRVLPMDGMIEMGRLLPKGLR